MTYELAKQLKDAGYPLIKIEHGMNCANREVVDLNPIGDEKIGAQHFFVPTLEELIEACGDGYMFIEHSQCAWEVFMGLSKENGTFDQDLKTAVAKLYIKLSKTQ